MTAKGRGDAAFAGKLIVLVDSASASSAEIFARTVQLQKRGIVIGDRSAGAVMEARMHPFVQGDPVAIFYQFLVTDADIVMPDGRSLEGSGVIPDELLLPTGADLAAGRDSRAGARRRARRPRTGRARRRWAVPVRMEVASFQRGDRACLKSAQRRERRMARTEYMTELRQDIGYALRMLRRAPGFTAVALTTLALGIGANSAIFSVVHGVLLAPLPFRDADRLHRVTTLYPDGTSYALSPPDFMSVREQTRTLDQVEAFSGGVFTMLGAGEPREVRGTNVSDGLLGLLGLPVALGRTLLPGENQPGREGVAVLDHGFWQRQFGGDRSRAWPNGHDRRRAGRDRRRARPGRAPAGRSGYLRAARVQRHVQRRDGEGTTGRVPHGDWPRPAGHGPGTSR